MSSITLDDWYGCDLNIPKIPPQLCGYPLSQISFFVFYPTVLSNIPAIKR